MSFIPWIFTIVPFILWIVFAGAGLYTLYLAIKALKIYIKNNS
ncbi:hypothetical protein JOC70_003620 [Clostridium pascui]|nr:hypothetical protein [Clostridium pascui]